MHLVAAASNSPRAITQRDVQSACWQEIRTQAQPALPRSRRPDIEVNCRAHTQSPGCPQSVRLTGTMLGRRTVHAARVQQDGLGVVAGTCPGAWIARATSARTSVRVPPRSILS
jgi:hypothetical protein